MSQFEELLKADADRRAAMIAADLDALTNLLHEDLVWTHSSGRTDDRAAVLESIGSGSAVFQSLDLSEPKINQHQDIYVFTGIVKGDVLKDGAPKRLQNKFLSVWKQVDSGFQMLAWQSTGIQV